MGLTGTGTGKRTVVKTYGRGSLLGFLSVPFAFIMARQGMHGWQDSAVRDMEDDAVAMARNGYQVVGTQQFGWPRLGIVYFRATYELVEPPIDQAPA
jgi:hypothetical protein